MIVLFKGGLGNQMFQFAYMLSQQQRYPEEYVVADIGAYEKWNYHNGFELERIFGIKLNLCDEKDVLYCKSDNIIDRFFYKIKIMFYDKKMVKDEGNGFDKSLESKFKKKTRIDGYFQSELYFENAKEEITRAFKFPPITDEKNIKLEKRIKEDESIAIHVRRGDFLEVSDFVNLSSGDYYIKAIDEIKQTVIKKRKWFIFSDDIEWCKDYFKYMLSNENVEFVCHSGNESYRDMQLMSMCKYMILANSTFSWWAGWLNKESKKIIAPQVWQKSKAGYNRDICPYNWERK